MTLYALTDLGHQYLLYGIAAAICLVVFVTLILTPALSAYGRVWEKAAAGFLSVFVLAALVIGGVVIGLAVVYYYTDIVDFLGLYARPGRSRARSAVAGIMAGCQAPRAPSAPACSTRSPKRSSPAPACPRWRARRRGCSTPASP